MGAGWAERGGAMCLGRSGTSQLGCSRVPRAHTTPYHSLTPQQETQGPSLKTAMKHLTKKFGKPSFCASAQLLSRLQRELEEVQSFVRGCGK